MNTKPARNHPLAFIRTAVWALMLLAAFISANHIVHTSEMLGLRGWYIYTTPFLIDLVAVVGKLSMLKRFDVYPEFQRSGKLMLLLGGALSLAANIAAGSNWGERGYGILVVGGFMLLENHLTKAAGKVREDKTVDPAAAARRQAAAAKAAQTRKANTAAVQQAAAAAAAQAQQAAAAALAAAGAKKASRNAAARQRRALQGALPVSPPPVGPLAPSIHVPTAAEIRKLVNA